MFKFFALILPFISGSISGIIASCSVYPLETIRTKITAQSNNNIYKNYFDCVKKSFNKGGIKGFYKGNVLYTLGMIPYQGTNFLTYEYLNDLSGYGLYRAYLMMRYFLTSFLEEPELTTSLLQKQGQHTRGLKLF